MSTCLKQWLTKGIDSFSLHYLFTLSDSSDSSEVGDEQIELTSKIIFEIMSPLRRETLF